MRYAGMAVIGAAVLLALATPAEAATPAWVYGAGGKLGRGVIGALTGWLDIPNYIVDTTRQQNVFAGMTTGLLQGLAWGVGREAVGLYEIVTFPLPLPANYRPILSPVYAFERSVPAHP